MSKLIHILYCLGAAVVLAGATIKITGYGGNEVMVVGLVTEAIIFMVAAFDNPCDDGESKYKWTIKKEKTKS